MAKDTPTTVRDRSKPSSSPLTTIRVPLKFPIELEDDLGGKAPGNMLSEVTLRRPKVQDRLRVNQKSSKAVEVEFHLISLLSGVPDYALEQMDLEDYETIQENLGKFASSV